MTKNKKNKKHTLKDFVKPNSKGKPKPNDEQVFIPEFDSLYDFVMSVDYLMIELSKTYLSLGEWDGKPSKNPNIGLGTRYVWDIWMKFRFGLQSIVDELYQNYQPLGMISEEGEKFQKMGIPKSITEIIGMRIFENENNNEEWDLPYKQNVRVNEVNNV